MVARTRLDSLAIAGREAMAFARQALLIRHDVAEPLVPADVAPGDDVVVFLHGLFATAGVLRPLRAAVCRHEAMHPATLTYFPGPGVEELAGRLATLMNAIPKNAWIHLVGHSLGGIVARFYAQEARDPRVVQTISMASPFLGVPRVGRVPIDTVRDLDEGSPILRKILLCDRAAAVPHLSIIAGGDTLVRSPVAHALPGGEVVVRHGVGHNTLLFDEGAAKIVEQRIVEARVARLQTEARRPA
jgi:pimeloyl-ACP methyl ester carboxylesterase